MKAVVKSKAEAGLDLMDIEVPGLRPGEVLVKVSAVGICGSDIHVYEWTSGYEWLIPYLPTVLGHEFCGTIVELGVGVKDFEVSNKVVCMPGLPCMNCKYCQRGEHNRCIKRKSIGLHEWGAFAEYVAIPATNCLLLDENISSEVAALAEPLAVVVNAIEISKLTIVENVAVMGPGPIGLMVTLLAKRAGASRVILIGTKSDRKRLEVGKAFGADTIIEVEEQDPVNAIMNMTRGLGVDHVFEASGASQSIKNGIKMVCKGGTMTIIGIHSLPVEIDINTIVRQEKCILGSYGSSAKTWQKVIPILYDSQEMLKNLITHRVQLDNILQGFKLAKSSEAIKVLVLS
ncbi:D-arabitol-phosphate dehydrogenase [subsurface metagenome]